jgi:glutathione S-transferase
MKLYTGDLSPYSAKVRMQIYAMGIQDALSFDLPVQFMMGKMNEVSPIGRIPVLEVDEGLIPESEVIAEYLDERFPDKALTGGSLKERADVRVVSRIADIYLMNNIFMSLSQANPETRVQAVLDLLIGQVRRGIGALEQHIGGGEFAVGDSLTRATAPWCQHCGCAAVRCRVLVLIALSNRARASPRTGTKSKTTRLRSKSWMK